MNHLKLSGAGIHYVGQSRVSTAGGELLLALGYLPSLLINRRGLWDGGARGEGGAVGLGGWAKCRSRGSRREEERGMKLWSVIFFRRAHGREEGHGFFFLFFFFARGGGPKGKAAVQGID